MRVKAITCLAFAIMLICCASIASASIVKLTYPAGDLQKTLPDIQPQYGQQSGSEEQTLGLISDVVGMSNDRFIKHDLNASLPDSQIDALGVEPLMAIPGPTDFLNAMTPPDNSTATAKANIYKTLVGTNLTYTSIAGKPMNYTITNDSIKSIDQTVYKNKLAWKVHVGDSMAWDLTMDVTGTKVLGSTQLFNT